MAARSKLRTTFGIMRMGVGVISLASPKLTGKIFGLGNIGEDASVALIARLFGIRDFVLGASLVFDTNEVRVKQAALLGVICDSTDVVSTVIETKRGVQPFGTIAVGGGAALFAAMGAATLAGK